MSDSKNERSDFDTAVNPLGKSAEYLGKYDAGLLFPIARQQKREELGIITGLPFSGEDIWNAYELSWLNSKGLPQVAIAEFRFPVNSPKIVESKSFKLYLNSLNQTSFNNMDSVQSCICKDLSEAVGAKVEVVIRDLDNLICCSISHFEATCIDSQNITIDQYEYDASLLKLVSGPRSGTPNDVREVLCSHLLKSNCLITNQPDWASIFIQYKGAKIDQSALLGYLVSFRTHNEFHEQCVERIYVDIMKYCQPKELTVYARYTRRGGLDINPWRSNCVNSMENIRLSRQ